MSVLMYRNDTDKILKFDTNLRNLYGNILIQEHTGGRSPPPFFFLLLLR